MTKKSSKQVVLTICKLFPLLVVLIGAIHGSYTLSDINSYLPTASWTTDLVTWLESNFMVNNALGTFLFGYMNYIILFHLIEVLIEFVTFLPHICLSFIDKIKGNGDY